MSQTDTKAFRAWFRDSKAVDANGEPLVVYHGTTRHFSEFDVRRPFGAVKPKTRGGRLVGQRDMHFFSADPDAAKQFAWSGNSYKKRGADAKEFRPKDGYAPVTMPVFLSLQEPLLIDARGGYWGDFQPAVIDAYDSGDFDGAIIANVIDSKSNFDEMPHTVYVAFRPEQIKSATGNRGTFDPTSMNIRNPAGGPLARVSWNLNKDTWTIRTKQGGAWKVYGYSPVIYLTGAYPVWLESERKKFLASKVRCVFAMWEGAYEMAPKGLRFQQAPWRRMTFNPHRDPYHFIDRETGAHVDSAQAVYGTSMETPVGLFADFYYLPEAGSAPKKRNPEPGPVTRRCKLGMRVGDELFQAWRDSGGDTLFRLDLLPERERALLARGADARWPETWLEVRSVDIDAESGLVDMDVYMRAA